MTEARDEFVRRFVASVLGVNVDVLSLLGRSEVDELFRALARERELGVKITPEGRIVWRPELMTSEELATAEIPAIDRRLQKLRAQIPVRFPGVAVEPTWPDAKPFAICISHDIDHVSWYNTREPWRKRAREMRSAPVPGQTREGLSGALRMMARIWRDKYWKRKPDTMNRFDQWLKIEADAGFKSSLYFFANEVEPWHPYDCNYGFGDPIRFGGKTTTVGGMMQEISRGGWEVSLHGSVASATNAEVFTSQKQQIERVIEQKLETTRQHYLQYDIKVTPRLHDGAGLLADSTQGFNDILGYRAGTSFPYRCWDWVDEKQLSVLEVPLVMMDNPLMLDFNTVDKTMAKTVEFMDEIARDGGCLSVLWHPWMLHTEAGFETFRLTVQEAKRRNAWGASTREVARWWREREARILGRPIVNAGSKPEGNA